MAEPEEFDLDAAYAEETHPPFRFRWAGKRWELAHIADLDWRLRSLADSMDIDAMQEVIEKSLPGERLEEWRKVNQPGPAMAKLFKRWLDFCGENPGEPPGSDVSSKSTAGPSNRTSRATTRSGSTGRSSARAKAGTARENSSP